MDLGNSKGMPDVRRCCEPTLEEPANLPVPPCRALKEGYDAALRAYADRAPRYQRATGGRTRDAPENHRRKRKGQSREAGILGSAHACLSHQEKPQGPLRSLEYQCARHGCGGIG